MKSPKPNNNPKKLTYNVDKGNRGSHDVVYTSPLKLPKRDKKKSTIELDNETPIITLLNNKNRKVKEDKDDSVES